MYVRKETAFWARAGLLLGISLWAGLIVLPPAEALHKTDHRFSVEGHVCGPDGKPRGGVEVIVKDTRIDEGQSATTDSDGYYKATLHLHDDNYLDPIQVSALDETKNVRAEFDPDDVSTERIITVDLGGPCQNSEGGAPAWVYYGAGVGLVAVVLGLVRFGVKRTQRRQSRTSKKGRQKKPKR